MDFFSVFFYFYHITNNIDYMAQNHRNNDSSDEELILWGIAAVAVIAAMYFLYPVLKEYFLTMKMWQLEIISRIVPTKEHINLLHQLKNTPSYNWTFDEVMSLGYTINYYFLPFLLIICFFVYTFTKDKLYVVLKYSKIYTRDSLLKQEKVVWKYLEPIAHKNLLGNDVPGWESAKKPKDIALEFKLLNNKKDVESLNEEKARRYFALQLGELYTGLENLKPYTKALVGCFFEFWQGNKYDAEEALMDIAYTFGADSKGKISFAAGLELFEKHKSNPLLIKTMSKHAYVSTALFSLFKCSKQQGIIITRYFLWLKEYDRVLFYALNSVGREVSWTESGGIFSHYQYEAALERPLAKIFVDEAVNGLKEALKNVKLTTKEV